MTALAYSQSCYQGALEAGFCFSAIAPALLYLVTSLSRCKTCIPTLTCMDALMPRAHGCAGAATCMDALMPRAHGCAGAVPGGHPCVDLSSQCNAESRIGCKPRPAGPVVPKPVVGVCQGSGHSLRLSLAAEHDRLPQSSHSLVQRVPNLLLVTTLQL